MYERSAKTEPRFVTLVDVASERLVAKLFDVDHVTFPVHAFYDLPCFRRDTKASKQPVFWLLEGVFVIDQKKR